MHHLIPRIQGGTDRRSNLVGLCSTCHHVADRIITHPDIPKFVQLQERLRLFVIRRDASSGIPVDDIELFDEDRINRYIYRNKRGNAQTLSFS